LLFFQPKLFHEFDLYFLIVLGQPELHFSSNKLFIRKKITALVTEHQLPTHSIKKKL